MNRPNNPQNFVFFSNLADYLVGDSPACCGKNSTVLENPVKGFKQFPDVTHINHDIAVQCVVQIFPDQRQMPGRAMHMPMIVNPWIFQIFHMFAHIARLPCIQFLSQKPECTRVSITKCLKIRISGQHRLKEQDKIMLFWR